MPRASYIWRKVCDWCLVFSHNPRLTIGVHEIFAKFAIPRPREIRKGNFKFRIMFIKVLMAIVYHYSTLMGQFRSSARALAAKALPIPAGLFGQPPGYLANRQFRIGDSRFWIGEILFHNLKLTL